MMLWRKLSKRNREEGPREEERIFFDSEGIENERTFVFTNPGEMEDIKNMKATRKERQNLLLWRMEGVVE